MLAHPCLFPEKLIGALKQPRPMPLAGSNADGIRIEVGNRFLAAKDIGVQGTNVLALTLNAGLGGGGWAVDFRRDWIWFMRRCRRRSASRVLASTNRTATSSPSVAPLPFAVRVPYPAAPCAGLGGNDRLSVAARPAPDPAGAVRQRRPRWTRFGRGTGTHRTVGRLANEYTPAIGA